MSKLPEVSFNPETSFRGSIQRKKKKFDDAFFAEEDRSIKHYFMGGAYVFQPYCYQEKIHPSWGCFPTFYERESCLFFCGWFPHLFGIDEDSIPSSDDDADGYLSGAAEELTKEFSPSILEILRSGPYEDLTEEEMKELVLLEYMPKYGRRARAKPTFDVNNKKLGCICDIDLEYNRHYVNQFYHGPKDELKTPHFASFWEDYHNKVENADLEQLAYIFEDPEPVKPSVIKGYSFRPKLKFLGAKKRDLKLLREELLSKFRTLDCREVRRYRMPYAEALYLELQEDSYLESAAFFKELLVKDHLAQEASIIKRLPLRRSRFRMTKLVLFLKVAERFSRNKEYHKEATILLKSGKYFNNHKECWWWLAEELFTRAVEVSQKSVIDGGKSEAIARYILGIFLLDCGSSQPPVPETTESDPAIVPTVSRVQAAQEHLSKARELSLGKKWSAEKILEKKQDFLYKECANYLCRALVAASEELRKNGRAEEALPLIHRSHILCEESGSTKRNVEMQTYFELGMTYYSVGMINWAKVAFRKFIEIAKLENDPRYLCDGYLELAICFRSEGDMVRCHHNLVTYLETATNHENANLTALAHRYLGEFYLNSGDPKTAADNFKKAFISFHEQFLAAGKIPFEEWKPEIFNLPHDVELARVLAGLAEGELLTKPICHTILQARDRKNQKELLRLILWKNRGDTQISVETVYDEELEMEAYQMSEHAFPTEGESPTMSEDALAQNLEMKTVRFAIDRESFA